MSPTMAAVVVLAPGGFYAIFTKLWEKHHIQANPLISESVIKIPEPKITINDSHEIITLAWNIQYITVLLTIILILFIAWIIRTEYTKYNIRVLYPKKIELSIDLDLY